MASDDKPGSFYFLGLIHHWALSRRGRWVVQQRTAKKRWNRGLKTMHEWCRRHRHEKIRDQHRTLGQKIRGHNAYYGVTGNGDSLARYRRECCALGASGSTVVVVNGACTGNASRH